MEDQPLYTELQTQLAGEALDLGAQIQQLEKDRQQAIRAGNQEVWKEINRQIDQAYRKLTTIEEKQRAENARVRLERYGY